MTQQFSEDAHKLINLEEELRQNQKAIRESNASPNIKLYLSIIETVIKAPLRRPDLVVLCGQEILFGTNSASHRKQIDAAQLWDLYEAVLKNALDLNQVELADSCLEAIQNQFGESIRVRKLEALVLEGKEDYDTSESIYNEILGSVDQSDQFCLRRLVAIKKALNDIPEAISALNKYLKIYMADSLAYSELADLYLTICDYKKAAFCVEELILIDPNNPMYFCKYADIMYTLDDFKTARKYYAQAINMLLDGEDARDGSQISTMRPVYGLLVSCNALAALNKFESTGSNTKKANTELTALAENLLRDGYKKHQPDLLPALEHLFKQ